ncbi:aldehyde dehydrogenase [Apiospora phragmitis]|uniref:Aldehyde dehydrogenase n=1 Tax=Apiospora phragmitis TaxID=2905665 RepID=A0ABR1WW96_9PEZI
MATISESKALCDARPSVHEPQQLCIGGSSCNSADGSTFPVVNPMTGDNVYGCASATIEDCTRAIDAASAAFEKWSRTSPASRRLILLKAADIIEQYLQQDAPAILSSEVSATKGWVRVNVLGTAGTMREVASMATHIKGEIIPAERPGTTILVEREPMGVCFAMSPWNAPVNLTARAVCMPLICGNTAVLKPSEFSPKSQYLVVRALQEAGLPTGCLNYLPVSAEKTPEVTEYIIKHPAVRHVNFTGSDRVGKIIAGLAASCLKPCVLELGGKAPLIILDDADVGDAVAAVTFGALANAGQICMSTERVIVHASVAEEFKSALVKRFHEIKVGDHTQDNSVCISGMFSPVHAQRVKTMLEAARTAGAQLLVGDMALTGPRGTIMGPHILDGVTPDMEIFRRESFGPLVCLTEFRGGDDDDEEAVRLANDSEYSLSGAVFSRDVMRALAVARRMRTGACHVNGATIFFEPTVPNGGMGGSSGYGRFGGIAGVEEFTQRKIITLARGGIKYPF